MLRTLTLNVVRNELACSYFRPNSKAWDVTRVQQDFHEDDVHLVLQTKIPRLDVQDRVAWSGTVNGGYSVKSGYYFWGKLNSEVNLGSNSKDWLRLWNLRIPHKMITFLWRFYKNNVPVRWLLRSKGVVVPITCPMCESDTEHLSHIFFDCKFAVECWQIAGLSFDMQNVEWVHDWLLDKISNEDEETVIKIAEILYCIWFVRNKKVWEGLVIPASVAMEISVRQVKDWQAAMERKMQSTSAQHTEVKTTSWSPPSQGCSKLNVDAFLANGGTGFTIGMLIRNDQGQFVRGKSICFQESVSVLEAEARGIQLAIEWIEEMGLQHIDIENDSEMVVKAVKNGDYYYSEIGHVLDFCSSNIRSRQDLSIYHVKRQANNAAHLMARVPCLPTCSNVFVSHPRMLLEKLLSDCL